MSVNNVLTPKQQMILHEVNKQDWFILINHGAKRSGKTFINNILFLNEVRRVRKIADALKVDTPQYILSGFSMANIQDNILTELSNTFGLSFKMDKFGSFMLFGVKIIQATHGNKLGVGRIRGMTAYGAYINEASLAQEEVFEEIKSRCSGKGARIICDTNPDNPEHWLKKGYIDNQDSMILNYHFELEDNSFLSQRYIDNIKNSTPQGMFYDRNILGLWVSGKGVVYSDFDSRKHYVTDIPYDDITTYYCGVDWGYEHKGCIVVVGETTNGTIYLLEEYTYKHKEIGFWVNVALDIRSRYGDIEFYCDSARPEHVARFQRESIKAKNARKNILSGIEMVSSYIKSDKFFVSRDDVNDFQKEIYNYVWNEKTGLPVKDNDDVMDALRYAVYGKNYNPVKVNLLDESIF